MWKERRIAQYVIAHQFFDLLTKQHPRRSFITISEASFSLVEGALGA